MENKKRLEQRMYFFVPYNLSPIQKGIQAGHAALEYAVKHGNNQEFKNFMFYDKIWIILDGGTANEGHWGYQKGSMEEIDRLLWDNKIKHAIFNEPDINNALTAICFLADERAWNKEDYPDFLWFIIRNLEENNRKIDSEKFLRLRSSDEADLIEEFTELYDEWFDLIGADNIFLRELLKGKKLAL
jgi:hypothetical protein